MSEFSLSCLGAIAVELKPSATAPVGGLDRGQAGALAEHLARDLARFVPAAAGLDLVLLAALFDPVELLRPGWPLHAELERLCALAPGCASGSALPTVAGSAGAAGPRVLAIGAADGALPASLRPSTDYPLGPLRLLPWLLRGDRDLAAAVGAELEAGLLDAGMAAADTALQIQDGFGLAVEHVRYLTVHDLAAMIALQYEHAGLASLWPLIEAALLAPAQDAWLDAAPEPLVRYSGAQARLALFDFDAWIEAGFAPAGTDAARLSRAFDRFQMRQRQLATVLEAHGVPVTFDHCPAGRDPRAILLS